MDIVTSLLLLLVGILAVWRVTHLIHAEDGPWQALTLLRRRLGAESLAEFARVRVAKDGVGDAADAHQEITLDEESRNGQVVGVVQLEAGQHQQQWVFSIVNGDPGGAFSIDETSGAIRLVDRATFDASESPAMDLTIQALSAASGFWGDLLACFYCLSLWVALPVALLIGDRLVEALLIWPALSGGAILLERTTSPGAV
jgi:hypothetical protein